MDKQKLEELKQKYLAEVEFRRKGDKSLVNYKYNIMVCGGTGCRSCKSKKVQDRLEEIVREKGLEKDFKINEDKDIISVNGEKIEYKES